MTTKNSLEDMMQRERDFYGAYTYQRIDKNESQYLHPNWLISN